MFCTRNCSKVGVAVALVGGMPPCPQRYRWHPQKNATQMPAIIVTAYVVELGDLQHVGDVLHDGVAVGDVAHVPWVRLAHSIANGPIEWANQWAN